MPKRPPPRTVSAANIRINKSIFQAKDLGELGTIVKANINKLNLVNCVTALQKIAKTKRGGSRASPLSSFSESVIKPSHGAASSDDQSIQQILCMRSLSELRKNPAACRARQIANAVWAVARIGMSVEREKDQDLEALVSALLKIAHLRTREFKHQEVSNLLWALGRIAGDSITRRSTSTSTIKQSGSHDAEDSIWPRVDRFLAILDESMTDIFVAELTAQGLSNSIWAIAKMSSSLADPLSRKIAWQLLHGAEKRVKGKARMSFNTQELANVLWACGKLSEIKTGKQKQTGPLLASITDAILTHFGANAYERSKLTSQQVANIAWARTKLSENTQDSRFKRHLQWLDELVLSKLKTFNSRELTSLLWSHAHDVAGGEVIMREILPIIDIHGFSGSQIVMSLWALARRNLREEKTVDALTEALREDKISGLSLLDVSNFAWAAARLGIQKKALIRNCMGRALAILLAQGRNQIGVSTKHMANLIWSLAKLRMKHAQIQEFVADEVENRCVQFDSHDLVNVSWAFATIYGGRARRGLMDSIAARGVKILHALNAQECSKFLWSMSRTNTHNEELDALAFSQRELSFSFKSAEDEREICVGLSSIPGGGRKLQNTGTAMWDASFVLADFLTRHSPRHCLQLLSKKKKSGKKATRGENSSSQSPAEKQSWWKGRVGVELGAGLGLPSIVAANLGVSMKASDGDDVVLKLLEENVRTNFPDDTKRVTVHKLVWDASVKRKMLRKALCITEDQRVRLLMGSGVLYGADSSVFEAFAHVCDMICRKNTLIVLAHGQGAAPGVHDTTNVYFEEMKRRGFKVSIVPSMNLHEDYQRSGCVVHLLKKKKKKKTKKQAGEKEQKKKKKNSSLKHGESKSKKRKLSANNDKLRSKKGKC